MANFDAKNQTRNSSGQFTGKTVSSPPLSSSFDPPLFSFKITNPVTYLKIWWRRVIANEGIDLRFRIRPLTAIALALVIVSGSFSLGFLARSPLSRFLPLSPSPSPPPSPPPTSLTTLDTAFTGTLRFSQATQKYYLLTRDSQAITLDVPPNVNLKNLVGRRIFAEGSFNKDAQTLKVSDAKEMEILPATVTPIPTIATASPTVSPK